ncbi:hypothetical protein Back2_04790 [Nocardioides baekrokdamisoli]|uniref:Lipoprotein n=2 Tax=Nocardioides baekrokdamisoli TaxID=1804624 RepID=A0A3G9ICU3_9ACTN|nr:hypothetical protein Back2_04790 [Nocardioides baekrokdamisoli]
MRRLLVVLVASLTAVVLTACGSSGSKTDPTQALQAAKAALDSTAGVHVTITSTNVPSGQQSLISADGVITRSPAAFKGSAKVSIQGFSADVDVTAIGGKIYATHVPLVGSYTGTPGSLGIPDPSKWLDTTTGVSTLLTQTASPTAAGQTRTGANNDIVVTNYTGTLTSAQVATVIPVSGTGTFQVTYQIGSDGKLVGATVTGPFYKGATSTYTLTLDQYGTAPTITVP